MFRGYFRKRKLAKDSQPAISGFTTLDNVKYMAVIIDAGEPGFSLCQDKVTKFCNDKGMALNLVYIDFRKNRKHLRNVTDLDATVLRHDINWYGKPDESKVSLLRDNPCDLLVCLAGKDLYSMEYLCGVAAAKFKIGRTAFPHDPFDIIVREPDSSLSGNRQLEVFDAMMNFLHKVNR